MYLIDTHTHLYSSEFDTDRTEMVENAIKAGVKKLLLPNIDVASIDLMYELCKQFPANCFPMMGLHPGYVTENWEQDLVIIRKALDENKHIAIGEIGMDFYWDKTFIEEQKMAFRIQIEWAKEFKLPIVIHARDAFDEIFEILDELNDANLTGVFHCFTGSLEQAQKIQSYGGFYFGIGGVLTYKKSDLPLVLVDIPLEQILLETDAPYLPPTPHRGKRNESKFLLHVAEKVAEVKNCSLVEVARITSENAQQLFRID
jgi:TatD DNase family protein